MAVDYVAKYTLKFNNLAGRGLLKVGKLADRVGKSLKNITLAGVAGGAGLAVALDRVNASLAEQVRLAKAVGSSHEDLIPLANAAKMVGMEFDNVVDLYEEMTNKVGEFKALGEQTALEEGLSALNINAAEFIKLNPAQQMEALLIAASKVDQQVASSAADMILGGEASKIFGAMNDEIRRSGKTAEEYLAIQKGLNVLTNDAREGALRYTSAMRQLSIFTGSVAQEAFGRLGAVVSPLIERLVEFISVNKAVIQTKISEYINKLADKLKSIDFKSLASRAGEFKGEVVELASKVKDLIQRAGGIKGVAILFGSLMAFTALAKVTVVLFTLFKGMKALAIGIRVVSLALIANPIGLLIAGIALIAVGAFLKIREHWDTIGPLFNRVKTWFIDLYEKAKPVLEAIGGAVIVTFGWISGAVSDSVATVRRVWSALWPYVSKVVKTHIEIVKGAINLLKGIFGKAISFGKSFGTGMAGVWGAVKEGALGMVRIVRSKIDALLSWLESVKNKAANIRDRILAGLGNDAAQERIEAREREARERAAGSSPFAGSGGSGVSGLEGTFIQRPDIVPAPEVNLTVNTNPDGTLSGVTRQDGATGSVSNISPQPFTGRP